MTGVSRVQDGATIATTATDADRGSVVRCRTSDGDRVVGTCAAVERDQAGVRVVLCPVDAARTPRRVCLPRTPRGWRRPYLQRWDDAGGEWDRCADVVALRVTD